MLKQFWEVKHLWGMPPKNSGGSTKFPGGRKVINRTAQTAFARVVTPREQWHELSIRKHTMELRALPGVLIFIQTAINSAMACYRTRKFTTGSI